VKKTQTFLTFFSFAKQEFFCILKPLKENNIL